MELPSSSDLASALVPLWIGDRGGHDDFVHLGAFAAAGSDGALVASCGDPRLVAFLRSSAKPFQAVAFLRRGLDAELGVGDEEVACACASHEGEPAHVDAARRILAAAGIGEDMLLCGTHAPASRELERAVARGEAVVSPIHNNCSGKHAAMLATCRAAGWPLESYTERDHPLQRENLATLAAFAGLRPDEVIVAVDNCTVPTFGLPLAATARAFARLFDPSGVAPESASAGTRAASAMTAKPFLVGGTGRLDTAIMEVTRGEMVVKTGANGFHAGARRATGKRPAVGFALKLGAAEAERVKAPVVIASLEAAGLLSREESSALAARFDLPQRSCRGAIVGGGRFVGRIDVR